MDCIRSHKHDIYVETVQKRGLCCYDDKRWLKDAFTSYSYGNYNIGLQNSNTIEVNSVACDRVTNDNDAMPMEVCVDNVPFKITCIEDQDTLNKLELPHEEQSEEMGDANAFEISGFQVTRCRPTQNIPLN